MTRMGSVEEVLLASSSSSSGSDGLNPMAPPNLPLLSSLIAVALAQFLKLFTSWYKERKWDSKRMLGSGGMPSSHSAGVCALAVAIGFQDGTGGSAFALAVVMACVFSSMSLCLASGFLISNYGVWITWLIGCFLLFLVLSRVLSPMFSMVMYDASGVRLHAGRQAQLLNQIVCELPPEHPVSNIKPLRDSLGHTPLQVGAGALLGSLVAYFMKFYG